MLTEFLRLRPPPPPFPLATYMHMDNPNHNITFENSKILSVEHKWFKRGVNEAIHIRALNLSLNGDGGLHNLSAIWNHIIKERLMEKGIEITNGRHCGGRGSLRNSVSVLVSAADTCTGSTGDDIRYLIDDILIHLIFKILGILKSGGQ